MLPLTAVIMAVLTLTPLAAPVLADDSAGHLSKLELRPGELFRGQAAAAILTLRDAAPERPPGVSLAGRPVVVVPDGPRWVALLGLDVNMKAGRHALTVEGLDRSGQPWRAERTIMVKDRDYGARNITVPREQVELSPEDLERAKRERVLVEKALATVSPDRLWLGPFRRPVPGEVISPFGRVTHINGQPGRNPHAGVDLRAATGVPVKAPAAGRVILTGEHFFAGGSVYLDHGQGLLTVYMHLSRIDVGDGDLVEAGRGIGLVGATGRVTGPHLHYAVRLGGARVDPLGFHEITSFLDERKTKKRGNKES